jgi:hypothetical protein
VQVFIYGLGGEERSALAGTCLASFSITQIAVVFMVLSAFMRFGSSGR